MSLNSFTFVILFVGLFILLLAIQCLRNKKNLDSVMANLQLLLILVFSIFFVFRSSWKFCICIILYATFVYVISLKSFKNKKFLVSGIAVSVVMLGYFKYTNFFINEFVRLFGGDNVALSIILPVGVSFYTFSGLSYIIDVYRGEYEAKKNFFEVLFYISFFPKLTAGPIVRGKEFFLQYENYRGVNAQAFAVGIQIFVFGLFKKIVLADRLGVFVDDVFFAPTAYNTITVVLAVISYSLQIYFDFSGYSDMAIGVAKIIGFDFKANFNLPYLAKGMSDFWKRWHISLSSWFQDYVYIPLGGSRKGNVRTYINLILVMSISGLWHGAGFTFIVWGVLHGIASCLSRIISKTEIVRSKVYGFFRSLITYIVVALLWVVFRAKDFSNAWAIWNGIFTIHDGIFQPYTWTFFAVVCLLVSTIVAVIHSKKNGEKYVNGFYPIMDLTKVVPLTIFFTFCGLTILLGYFGNTAFIYGKF